MNKVHGKAGGFRAIPLIGIPEEVCLSQTVSTCKLGKVLGQDLHVIKVQLVVDLSIGPSLPRFSSPKLFTTPFFFISILLHVRVCWTFYNWPVTFLLCVVTH